MYALWLDELKPCARSSLNSLEPNDKRPVLARSLTEVREAEKVESRCGGEGGIRTLDELLTHTHFPGVLLQPLGHLSGMEGGNPIQPHLGTRVRRCRCSLPGLTGFTTCRCEGTGKGHHRRRAYYLTAGWGNSGRDGGGESEDPAFEWADDHPVDDCTGQGQEDDDNRDDAEEAPAVEAFFFGRGGHAIILEKMKLVGVRLERSLTANGWMRRSWWGNRSVGFGIIAAFGGVAAGIIRRYAAHPSRGPLTRYARCALSRPAGSARTGGFESDPQSHQKEKGVGRFASHPFFFMARLQGFEPRTPKFVAWCSIQLSYSRGRARIIWKGPGGVKEGCLVRSGAGRFQYNRRAFWLSD